MPDFEVEFTCIHTISVSTPTANDAISLATEQLNNLPTTRTLKSITAVVVRNDTHTAIPPLHSVVQSDSDYLGEITAYDKYEHTQLVLIHWHKWGPDDDHPDNFNTWERPDRYPVVTQPIPGQWWPKTPPPTS